MIEQSVNWEDDDLAIHHTLHQSKEDGQIQFRSGVAVIPRSVIDELCSLDNVAGCLDYERQPLDDNPYHGNLLLLCEVDKSRMKMIASYLALRVSRIVPQPD